MGFSASIPAAQIETANAALETAGFGAGNFETPLRSVGSTGDASHAALNCLAENAAFRTAVALIPNVVITDGAVLERTFPAHVAAQALEWEDPTNWFQNPVMTGDLREYDGKTWESLVDFNVWTPPVAWREVVAQGYPAWVQPTGAHDAYPMGFRVTHNGQNWENIGSAANVWEPGIFGWSLI